LKAKMPLATRSVARGEAQKLPATMQAAVHQVGAARFDEQDEPLAASRGQVVPGGAAITPLHDLLCHA